jgi:dTDP-4-dehydrorhamnose reductase
MSPSVGQQPFGREAIMQRLLVTGIDRAVGANLAMAWAQHHEVVGIACAQVVSLPGVELLDCGPLAPDRLAAWVARAGVHRVIHCGTLADPAWVLPDEPPAPQREPHDTAALADAARAAGAALTVLCTDGVFAGPRVFHAEDAPLGAGPWAEAARAVEAVLRAGPHLLVRTHAFGFSPTSDARDFAQQAYEALAQGQLPPIQPGRYATPIVASRLAWLLEKCWLAGMQGTVHLAGAERASMRRFALELALACGLSPPRPVPWGEAAATPPRPAAETSLLCSRAERCLGVSMPLLRESLQEFAQQAHHDAFPTLQSGVPIAAKAA